MLAFQALDLLVPSYEDAYIDANRREAYDKLPRTEITLAWKDMKVIWGNAKDAPKELIKLVFDSLIGMSSHDQIADIFPGAKFEDPGVHQLNGIMRMVIYEGIDRLGFNAGLLSWIDSIGKTYAYKREIIKIMVQRGTNLFMS